jgi:hypothetical protein
MHERENGSFSPCMETKEIPERGELYFLTLRWDEEARLWRGHPGDGTVGYRYRYSAAD